MGQLKEFIIYGLWEERNYQLKFEDEKLVIVGENGSGKTTVLRIFYDTLSGKWARLLRENFNKIKIKIDEDERVLAKEDLGEASLYEASAKLIEELPFSLRHQIELWDRIDFNIDGLLEMVREMESADEYRELIDHLESKVADIPQKVRDISRWLKNNLPYKIIYYPTYRRVEGKSDTGIKVRGYGTRRRIRYQETENLNLEIAYSGMKDVDEIIKMNLREIEQKYNLTSAKLNMSCFKGILTQDYVQTVVIADAQTDPEYIEMVFNSFTGITLLEEERAGSTVAFASTVAGEVLPVDVGANGGMICQKGAFLCAQETVHLNVTFTKKFSAGLFGGEGFILQDISGTGMVFLEIDGNKVEKDLAPGEVLKVDTGNVVAFERSVNYEIETVKGLKNIFLGGEGLFLTKLTGPGRVILQTQNFNEFAGRIIRMVPSR